MTRNVNSRGPNPEPLESQPRSPQLTLPTSDSSDDDGVTLTASTWPWQRCSCYDGSSDKRSLAADLHVRQHPAATWLDFPGISMLQWDPRIMGASFLLDNSKVCHFGMCCLNRQGTINMPRNIPPRVHTMSHGWIGLTSTLWLVLMGFTCAKSLLSVSSTEICWWLGKLAGGTPNPPLPNKCQECREFTKQGSTGYTIRKTCLVCGHSETTRRDMVPLMTPENCPHDDTDFRGSSKSTHRTFCKKCCTFIDEAPMQIRKERVAIAKKVETASVRAVPIVESLVEESDGLNPVSWKSCCPCLPLLLPKTCQSEVMTRARLHELLHQAINDVTEEEDSFFSCQWRWARRPLGQGVSWVRWHCLHGSDIQYPQDLVYMNFETVDIARSSMSLQCWMKVATALVIAKPGQSMQKHDWPVWVTACLWRMTVVRVSLVWEVAIPRPKVWDLFLFRCCFQTGTWMVNWIHINCQQATVHCFFHCMHKPN